MSIVIEMCVLTCQMLLAEKNSRTLRQNISVTKHSVLKMHPYIHRIADFFNMVCVFVCFLLIVARKYATL